ncbi:UNVERIFIED_CONTAM: hypothetical protein GTU68_036277 [Idotea baltica]|nr:hypothetical protein [Idotea baltica]
MLYVKFTQIYCLLYSKTNTRPKQLILQILRL